MRPQRILENPLISIIIPTYNGAAALRRAIASVLGQTYPHFEMIIVDDASKDPIETVVREFSDSRIIYIRQTQNKGAAAARNIGIRQSQGTVLAFLDSDDEFVPEKLRTQLDIFRTLPEETGLVITNLRAPDEQNNFYLPKEIPSGYVTKSAFPGSIFSPPSSWMLKKTVIETAGVFDELIDIIEDADYFVRILEHSRIFYLNQALTIKYPSQERKGYFSNRHFSGNKHFLEKNLNRLKKDKKYFSHFYYLMAKDYVNSGNPKEAKTYFLKAFTVLPKLNYLFKYVRCSWPNKKRIGP